MNMNLVYQVLTRIANKNSPYNDRKVRVSSVEFAALRDAGILAHPLAKLFSHDVVIKDPKLASIRT
jgi:hypothetical protein